MTKKTPAHKAILKQIKKGNTKWAGDIASVSRKKDKKIRIRGVTFWGPWKGGKVNGRLEGNNGGMTILWQENGVGFGETSILLSRGRKPELQIYTEAMGNKFLGRLIQEVVSLAKRMD